MNTEADWREAARGIPVWEGSRVCRIGLRGVGTVQAILPGGGGLTLWGDGATLDPREFFPNLTDPDTRAAYDRRLALALGAPGEEADRGAVAYVHEDYGCASLVVDAGPGVRGFTWSRSVRVGDSGPGHFDLLLARALAWPADKRVTG